MLNNKHKPGRLPLPHGADKRYCQSEHCADAKLRRLRAGLVLCILPMVMLWSLRETTQDIFHPSHLRVL